MSINNSVYIPSIDGKDLIIANKCNENGYTLRNKKGEYNLMKFINTLDYSLDLIKLREVYEKVYRRRDFSFWNGKKEYTNRVINVTFKYSNKEFNKLRTNVYVKFGSAVEDSDFNDCVCIRDGELIGIKTNDPVVSPISNELLGKYFYFDNGVYKAKTNITTINSVAEIREQLYLNGFICDGVKYIRFKRSSGSSRVGKCLFIDEKLYYRMHKWEMCGIKIKNGDVVELASLEPYIALTLSSIIDTIQIEPQNILVVDDYESVFKDKAIATRLVDGRLVSKPEEVTVKNSIWDGQSLMDKSLFGKYCDKGMLLLRARFFKSCCFNANIQQWFKDNGIKSVSQLNGITVADKIEDIKLITTPSSIKYLKFGTLKKWFDNLESTFGVVKYEKPTFNFNGRMVQCHYQLLNTLQMSYDEVAELVKPSLDFAELIKSDPAALRYCISYEYQNPDDKFSNEPVTFKEDIVYKMLSINDEFSKTKIYEKFKNDKLKGFIKNLRKGHVLVNGNYSTLCGNPVEMLKQSIGKFDGTSIIEPKTIHSINFKDGEDILGSRSPHVTIGNILITKNKIRDEICRYLNPTREIVYVNSIGENLLERLSGSDFDSDTLLLTNNEILINSAKRNYDRFLVPTKLINSVKRERRYTAEEQADLDIKTSVNKIGEIINLSQELNSKLWDRLNNGAELDEIMELYCDISQLDVMSCAEIDSAKRENPANNVLELKLLKSKYDTRDEKGRYVRPKFFKYLDDYKGYRVGYYIYMRKSKDEEWEHYDTTELLGEAKDTVKELSEQYLDYEFSIEKGRMTYKSFDTSMDYLQKCIDKFKTGTSSKKKYVNFSDVLLPSSSISGYVKYSQVYRVLDAVRDTKKEIAKIWQDKSDMGKSKRRELALELMQECVNYIDRISMGKKTMRYLLTCIEDQKNKDISRYLFNILFATANEDFYNLIDASRSEIYSLEENDFGDIDIYGMKFAKVLLS